MTSSYNLATSPIVNDPDYPKFYNPADGDGEPSSTWTVTSYAQAFGVSLTGTRQVTKSVSFDVKISETGEMFGQRIWNVYCPFVDNEEDWDAIEKVDDNGGDEEIMAAVGLYFVTDEMVNGGGSIEPGDITEAFVAPKAVTLQGAVYDGGDVVGIVELKLGKVNDKKHTGKVSGSVTTLDGKKHMIKAYNVTEIGAAAKAVSLEVKDFGTMNVTIGGRRFAGSMGEYHVQSANVGGNWAGGGATVTVAAAGDLSMFAGTVCSDLLPNGERVTVTGGKWKFAKAASVKWAKPKKGAAQPEIYDEVSGKGLIVDATKGKTNRSGLRLTYTPKKGTFKGSFKVYALEGTGKATKLKKYTVNVSGVVVGGIGYGTATCKRPAVSWPVTVR